ncbi:DUF4303 domain-containing protein [Cellulomonas triticagri]|uniref:DUF4303 domain-containing protein n=1 Tax=Cellulomonas triticagri TaxID=2483352 RepID=A0A3M2JJ36_9CELL|nr:DUF4303 domain-containing protein [Cellulomonas triticagri]RMI13802.1 DUF4303 domain-containing protein [Cellulomonas triticagri]
MDATTGLDLEALLAAATAQVVTAVRAVRTAHPDEHVYGAVPHEFYGDGTAMAWPCVSVGTDESLAAVVARYADELGMPDREDALRWSGADLPYFTEPDAAQDALAARCQDVAAAAQAVATEDFVEWDRVYETYLRVFPRAAAAAREVLVADETVDADFVAVAFDEAADLVPLSVTPEQLRQHFPELAADT